jgi:fatty acid/phospholipid synthesis protein PlsX
LKIALDAMGGDFAPKEIVLGAVQAGREFGAEIILVGVENQIKNELNSQQVSGLKLEICHASEVIAMDEHPANAVKRKKDSSLIVANRLVKEGTADAVISVGNTGAAMAASLLTLGRISGIKRPAIASLMPTKTGVSVILDAGANADCEAENLLEFALMGSAYAELVLGIANPKIGLLSIGEEETKGNKLTIDAHQLLKNGKLNFIGNIEGRDVHRGVCQVVVCDGFVGNVVLKLSEGLASVLLSSIKEAISANAFSMLGGLLIKGPLKKMLGQWDPAEYGGMPLLGLNGVSMIGHGSSKAKAVKNAIKAAMKAVDQDIIGKIGQAVVKA